MSEWQQDPYVQKWLGKLKPKTRENCVRDFPKFLEWCGKSPTELIQMKIESLKSSDPTQKGIVEDLVIQYKRFLEGKGLKENTVKSHLNRVMSFFSHNYVKLTFARKDLKVEVAKSEKAIVDWYLNREEVKELYAVADVRDRGLLLMLYQSGLSEVDVSEYDIEDLPKKFSEAKEGEHVFIAIHREKTDIEQLTCFSCECTHDLKAMLRERGNPTSGPLFVSSTYAGKQERLSVRSISIAIKNLCRKAFPDRVNEFKTKNLRGSYNAALLSAEPPITQEVKDLMMGHQRVSARKDYPAFETPILQAYKRAFRHLSVNGGLQLRSDMARMETTVDELAKRIVKIEEAGKEYLEGNIKLATDLRNLTKQLEDVNKQIQQYATKPKPET